MTVEYGRITVIGSDAEIIQLKKTIKLTDKLSRIKKKTFQGGGGGGKKRDQTRDALMGDLDGTKADVMKGFRKH